MQSMAYKVIIMPPAKRRLDMYVYYTLEILKKQTGGKVNSCRCKRNKKATVGYCGFA